MRAKEKVAPSHLMQPMSFWQALLLWWGHTAVQYPKYCEVCGKPSKGNRLLGYRFICSHLKKEERA